MANLNTDETIRKPRRTKGTPFFVQRNYYAAGTIAVGGLFWLLYELWPASQKLKKSLLDGKFKDSPDTINRSLAARLSTTNPSYSYILRKISQKQRDAEDALYREEDPTKEEPWNEDAQNSTSASDLFYSNSSDIIEATQVSEPFQVPSKVKKKASKTVKLKPSPAATTSATVLRIGDDHSGFHPDENERSIVLSRASYQAEYGSCSRKPHSQDNIFNNSSSSEEGHLRELNAIETKNKNSSPLFDDTRSITSSLVTTLTYKSSASSSCNTNSAKESSPQSYDDVTSIKTWASASSRTTSTKDSLRSNERIVQISKSKINTNDDERLSSENGSAPLFDETISAINERDNGGSSDLFDTQDMFYPEEAQPNLLDNKDGSSEEESQSQSLLSLKSRTRRQSDEKLSEPLFQFTELQKEASIISTSSGESTQAIIEKSNIYDSDEDIICETDCDSCSSKRKKGAGAKATSSPTNLSVDPWKTIVDLGDDDDDGFRHRSVTSAKSKSTSLQPLDTFDSSRFTQSTADTVAVSACNTKNHSQSLTRCREQLLDLFGQRFFSYTCSENQVLDYENVELNKDLENCDPRIVRIYQKTRQLYSRTDQSNDDECDVKLTTNFI